MIQRLPFGEYECVLKFLDKKPASADDSQLVSFVDMDLDLYRHYEKWNTIVSIRSWN